MGDQKETKNEREKLVLKFHQEAEFETQVSTMLVDAESVAKYINGIFKPVFRDYKGCTLEPVQDSNHLVRLSLIFYPKWDNGKGGSYVAFADAGTSTKDRVNAGPRVTAALVNNAINKMVESYEPTQDLVDIVYPLLNYELTVGKNPRIQDNPKSFIRNKLIAEGVDQSNNVLGMPQYSQIYNVLYCVDINRVLAKVFGEKDPETGHNLAYEVMVGSPYMRTDWANTNPHPEYTYQIKRFDIPNVNETLNRLGARQRIGVNMNIYEA